jgi:hypothetical protein
MIGPLFQLVGEAVWGGPCVYLVDGPVCMDRLLMYGTSARTRRIIPLVLPLHTSILTA